MNHSIKLQLTPVYIKQAPLITLLINGKTIFNDRLTNIIDLEHALQFDRLLQVKIKRSGRTKSIIDSDPENGFTISKLNINGVEIKPDIGSYQCTNNDYIEPHVIHGKRFTLNGEYCLEIPHYTLRGHIMHNLGRFDINGQHYKYCFFGASMTAYDFTLGIPPIHGKQNYANLFIQQMGGVNLASGGQSTQEIFETVYKYLKNNKVDVCLVQLTGAVTRQVKNANTKEIYRWSPHLNKNLDHVDEFTKLKLKNIQEFFVYLDTSPIIALQIPEYKKLIAYAENRGSKIFFISHYSDEYQLFKQVIPNNMAPYFEIDYTTKYCKDNGHHATPEEQENYSQRLIDFVRGKNIK